MTRIPSMKTLAELADAALEAKIVADEAKEQYEDRMSALEEALERAHRLNPDTKAFGHTRIKITPNNYFDVSAAAELLDQETLNSTMEWVMNNKKVKENLTPKQLETCMKPYARAFKIGIAVLDD